MSTLYYDRICYFSDIDSSYESEDEDVFRLYYDESVIKESQKYTDEEYDNMDKRLLQLLNHSTSIK